MRLLVCVLLLLTYQVKALRTALLIDARLEGADATRVKESMKRVFQMRIGSSADDHIALFVYTTENSVAQHLGWTTTNHRNTINNAFMSLPLQQTAGTGPLDWAAVVDAIPDATPIDQLIFFVDNKPPTITGKQASLPIPKIYPIGLGNSITHAHLKGFARPCSPAIGCIQLVNYYYARSARGIEQRLAETKTVHERIVTDSSITTGELVLVILLTAAVSLIVVGVCVYVLCCKRFPVYIEQPRRSVIRTIPRV